MAKSSIYVAEPIRESKLRKTCLYFEKISISIACESENCGCMHVQCFKRIEFFFISVAALCGQMCFVWAMWACQERIMLER